ncbi:MAG: hypothetical protein GEV00_20055 [Actinophytocola sp.]|nr:hypothetical protein [Actinophytocola sp.]
MPRRSPRHSPSSSRRCGCAPDPARPPLGHPENATTVRVEGGKTLTTDGPFVGMKEAVGSVFVLEAGDLDAAIEVAARVPAARYGGAVELRPSEVVELRPSEVYW